MMFVAIGVTLFVLGAIVERSGRKLGTALALLPVLVWFWFLMQAQLNGEFGEQEARDHAIALVVGLLCFIAGSFVVGTVPGWLRKRRDLRARE
ncbi:hypothetical protein RAC69_14500 [Microbacterium sp. LS_15]|uniref:hypothetical protein n=1 Tax=Microbacterium sp. LS_15 TaxID=3055790 RepID=UPI0035BF45A1